MSSKKPLRIGMVGTGFMGRTHSNAFRQVQPFFDLPHVPVLQAICARNGAAAQAFAERWATPRWKPIGASWWRGPTST